MADAGEQSSPTPSTSAPSATGTSLLGQAGTTPSPDPAPPNGSPPKQAPAEGEPQQPQQPNDEPEGEPAEKAPDEAAYAALKLAEGVVPDEAALADFKKLAAETRLPVEAAQRLLDLHGRMQAETTQRFQADLAAEWQSWQTAAQQDPYLTGAEVANGGFRSMKDALGAAGRFLDAYGDSELRELLTGSAVGNHASVIRALAKAGRDIASDQLVGGRGASRADPLRAMYPTMSEEFFPH
jgi:hypothetical protein